MFETRVSTLWRKRPLFNPFFSAHRGSNSPNDQPSPVQEQRCSSTEANQVYCSGGEVIKAQSSKAKDQNDCHVNVVERDANEGEENQGVNQERREKIAGAQPAHAASGPATWAGEPSQRTPGALWQRQT